MADNLASKSGGAREGVEAGIGSLIYVPGGVPVVYTDLTTTP
jgi:hypothetical protein